MSANAENPIIAPPNPRDLVKRPDVEIALKTEKGQSAQLESFQIEDFTSKGDNYASIVSSVKVNFEKDGKRQRTSYIVKLNPCVPIPMMEKIGNKSFEKETKFYENILPLLNAELEKIKEPRLRTPKHFHSVTKEGEQVIYLEDLRPLGFKMTDRQKGMDKHHTMLILRELGRWHAASVLFLGKDEYKGADILNKFPELEEFMYLWMELGDMGIIAMMDKNFEQCAKLADKNKGYGDASAFLRSKIGKIEEMVIKMIKHTEPFKVICHGDCWNNNFLFR